MDIHIEDHEEQYGDYTFLYFINGDFSKSYEFEVTAQDIEREYNARRAHYGKEEYPLTYDEWANNIESFEILDMAKEICIEEGKKLHEGGYLSDLMRSVLP